jgi:hypothetical protein
MIQCDYTPWQLMRECFFPLFYCSLSPLPVLCAVQLMHDGPALFNPEVIKRIPIKFS